MPNEPTKKSKSRGDITPSSRRYEGKGYEKYVSATMIFMKRIKRRSPSSGTMSVAVQRRRARVSRVVGEKKTKTKIIVVEKLTIAYNMSDTIV